jgi:hypothetical protein
MKNIYIWRQELSKDVKERRELMKKEMARARQNPKALRSGRKNLRNK